VPKHHYTLYCDESAKQGPHFSNFYGGVLLLSSDRQFVEESLERKKRELNLFGELKWTKVTENYLSKYIEFIDLYFDFIQSSKLKIRIMFTQNFHKPIGLSSDQLESRYFILYYQLIKHAFGFTYCNPDNVDDVYVSILLDDMPDTEVKITKFKKHLSNISVTNSYRGRRIFFPHDSMSEILSNEHAILQGLDIILGSMQFRLNDQHKVKPEGASRRGKRTIAKEKLYKVINARIRGIYPGFNIGGSTGHGGDKANRWLHPYRHWLFIPREWEADHSFVKR
jgi:hypothetical protein